MQKMMVPLKRYAQFSGRASRSEFWWFQLFTWILMTPTYVLTVAAAITESSTLSLLGGSLMLMFGLFLAVPMLAVTVRRLHDSERTGWWYLLVLVPFGSIALLVFLVLPGTASDNRFGPPVPHV